MKVLVRQALLGPNIYAPQRILRFVLDREALQHWPGIGDAPGVTSALLDLVPWLARPQIGSASLIDRLRRGERLVLGTIVAETALALQNMAGAELTFAAARPGPGSCEAMWAYDEVEVGLRAGLLSVEFLRRLLAPASSASSRSGMHIEPIKARDLFLDFARQFALPTTTAALVREAERRGIPWSRLAAAFGFVRFGQGSLQKRISGSSTSELGAIGFQIAKSKALHNEVFRRLGLPVARHQVVMKAADAVRAAERLGYPVVVKPNGDGKGHGVSVGVVDAKGVEAAFSRAQQFDAAVIVEQFVVGDDHRLFVVGGKLLAAAKRIPAHVIGDGAMTIAALIEAENRDPRRGIGAVDLLERIRVDDQVEAVLAASGHSLRSVPAEGEVVFLRRTANVSTGGTPVDVTRIVHTDNRWMAERAAVAAGIDVAGVDFLTPDISRSYKEVGGAMCEVNTWADLRPHCAAEGSPNVVRGVMEMLYPPGTDGRIPTAAITGTNGKTTTSVMVAQILRSAGHRVGLCTTEGIYVDGHEIAKGDWAGYGAARLILADPLVDAAVLETARGGIIRYGLGFDQCDVAAVTNLTDDHLGVDGIETLEQMAEVKAVVVATARRALVLNAEDEWCEFFARRSTAERIVYVAMDENHPRLLAHIAAGGGAAFRSIRDGRPRIVLHDIDGTDPVIDVEAIPTTFGGRADHIVQNALLASAIARAMGQTVEAIRLGLSALESSLALLPARTWSYDGHPFKVICDYGHNPASLAAMRRFLARLETTGRRIAVLQLPGNRRDGHFAAVCRELAGAFDHYLCYQSDVLRGRRDGELPGLLRDGLIAGGVSEDRIAIIPDQRAAIDAGLRMARPGDLVLVLVDRAIDRCWRQIVEFDPRHERARAPNRP